MGPYAIKKVFDAASFMIKINPYGILLTTPYTAPTTSSVPAPSSSSVYPSIPHIHASALSAPMSTPLSQPEVKTEDLAAIFTKFSKHMSELFKQNRSSSPSYSSQSHSHLHSGDNLCNFCGKEHFIHDCDLIDDYARTGKCKRNIDRKVILPSGTFIPCTIPGNLLEDRIDEWHRCNPGQLANGLVSNSMMMFSSIPNNAIFTQTNKLRPPVKLSVNNQIAHFKS